MNIWENTVITAKGLALLSKLVQGNDLTITKAVSGAGYVTPGTLQNQIEVSDQKQTLKFRTFSVPAEGKSEVTCYLTNEGLTAGYTATQIGVYAEDPQEGEVLFFIAQAPSGAGTIVPAENESPGYSAEWAFIFPYGQADNVHVTVDPSNSVSHREMEARIAAIDPQTIGAAPAKAGRCYGSLKDIGITSLPTTLDTIQRSMPEHSMLILATDDIHDGVAEGSPLFITDFEKPGGGVWGTVCFIKAEAKLSVFSVDIGSAYFGELLYGKINWLSVSNNPKIVRATLSSSNWVGSEAPYTYTITGYDGKTVEVVEDVSMTMAQLEAIENAKIKSDPRSAENILYAFGEKPTINVPVLLIVR